MKWQIVYRPGHADEQKWVVDRNNPAWPISYPVEKATDWGWLEFIKRIDAMSPTAWRALLWALRKQDEPRLQLEYVEIDDWNDIDLRVECLRCGEFKESRGTHECALPEPEDDEQPDAEAEEPKAGDPDPEA